MRIDYTPGAENAPFWSCVNKQGPTQPHMTTPCWEWTLSRHDFGYGKVLVNGTRPHLTHRVSWQFAHSEIPQGMRVLHRCDNPPCVNPEHLFLGTLSDNTRDMVAKGRHHLQIHPEAILRGESHGMVKLTETQVIECRRRAAAGERTEALARELGLTRSAVARAISGITWSHLPGAVPLVRKGRTRSFTCKRKPKTPLDSLAVTG